MTQNLDRLSSISSLPELLTYLRDVLHWDFETDDVEDLTYEYSAAEFGLDSRTAANIREIKQIRPVVAYQPWGIFYLDFASQRISVVTLRAILRGLVAKKRASANQSEMQKWDVENILFITTSDDFKNFNFAYFRGEQTNRAVLSTFGWHKGDTHLRTLAEFNLPALGFPTDTSDAEGWLKKWRAAFDVEAVTDKFFKDYRKVFETVEKEVKASITNTEAARLYTQRLFNRLMFIYFIQKKGWLEYEGSRNYLRLLYSAAESSKENFLRDRLYYVFFWGLSNVGESIEVHTLEALEKKRGRVPYLNGGLFDIEDDYDSDRDKVKIPNDAFRHILDLFERYNFTVEESTPLNVQVAVDPEMLGKVFEELVTGRHESGSYYTPRQIVSFMCREALKHYLAKDTGGAEAASRFVDEGDGLGLQNPESVLEALRRVRVCDPACGSGAYLLGMMQELVRLRGALFASQQIGDDSAYKIKRSIIENNLYGVDKDQFAVQIAALRLWLSLAIDSEKPQPLPNLDFKIEQGDSLIAPAPSSNEKTLFFNRRQKVLAYGDLKRRFSGADGVQKQTLRRQIDSLRLELAEALKHKAPRPSETKIELTRRHAEDLPARIRKLDRDGNKTGAAKLQKELQTVTRQLATWDQTDQEMDTGFDWAVEFAEVFVPPVREDRRMDDAFAFLNDYDLQGTMLEQEMEEERGGFDIVVANPPYVRMELFRPIKPILRRNFPGVHSERADLYVYFYDRAQQLLKEGGIGAFISSNKWLRAGYGENLRQNFLDSQAFHLVVDFGDLPVFKATTYPAIFVWQKQHRDETPTRWAVVQDLESCYAKGVREYVAGVTSLVPALQFGKDKPRLTALAGAEMRSVMLANGLRLGELAKGLIGRGVVSGLNDAFVINQETRDEIIARDKRSSEMIKPLIKGDSVRRYQVHFGKSYLIYMNHGTSIDHYPAIEEHLATYRSRLEKRATEQEWFELQQPQAAYIPFFNKQKIVYPDIAKDIRFAMDTEGFWGSNTTYFVAREDWYLLSVLNSSSVAAYFRAVNAEIRGGYMRFFGQYMENLPIPNAPADEQGRLAELARETQGLHTARRRRVQQFLGDIGASSAAFSSRNPLEQPWRLTKEEFSRRAPRINSGLFVQARDETHDLTEHIAKVEREIDERVAALYGVPLDTSERATLGGVEVEPPFA